MKRGLVVFALFVFVFGLCACSGGNVAHVDMQIGESEIYEDAEIRQAMDIVKIYFSAEFAGCELTELWYDEQASQEEAEEWAEQYDAEQAIVLFSNFKVDESGGDGSLEPNATYSNWNWILVRDGWNWNLKTWGY